MNLKKRKKSTRYRGSQTHKRGHRKRTKGSGNKGGVGMSGSENQKKSWVINKFGIEYFGRDKALRRGHSAPKLKVINLSDLIERFDSLIKQGVAKQTPKGFEFNLKGYKILGNGRFEFNLIGYKILGNGPLGAKIFVKASAASKQAIEQIKAAGGSVELDSEEEKESKEEKPKAEAKKEKA